MIRFKSGNILSEDAEALVNTVNCVGVMGRGIALQFKKAYPDNFNAYASACRRREIVPGRMFLYETRSLANPRYIINFPTKRHWRANSRIEDIDAGLTDLVRLIRMHDIRSIALPPLGSGLGRLPWASVRQLMEHALEDLHDVDVTVLEPDGAPPPQAMPRASLPKITAGRAALISLMHQYINALLDPMVTLLEVHKLMYFIQVARQPLRLTFVKGRYGPYADNLRHVLHQVEGHLISGYADGGDTPDKALVLLPGAVHQSQASLESAPRTRQRLARVSNLIEGFESSFGLELLSTVHWVLDHEPVANRDDVVARVHAWNSRKRMFSPRQIQLAADVLADSGWALPARTH